jgi:hypothetical protein
MTPMSIARCQTAILALAMLALTALAPAPASAQAPQRDFPETGQTLAGPFLTFWEEQGGLARFGYPISPPLRGSGAVAVIQWTERARFELHDDPAQPVKLGLLGREVAEGRGREAAFRRVGDPGDGSWYEPTGHTLRGGFRVFWEENGGLPVFGYPISEEFEERNPADGLTYVVQYFERNRFEYHLEHLGTPHVVQLGLLGRQLYRGGGTPVPMPALPPRPSPTPPADARAAARAIVTRLDELPAGFAQVEEKEASVVGSVACPGWQRGFERSAATHDLLIAWAFICASPAAARAGVQGVVDAALRTGGTVLAQERRDDREVIALRVPTDTFPVYSLLVRRDGRVAVLFYVGTMRDPSGLMGQAITPMVNRL